MPPKKRALAEVDSNAPIQESKSNKKGKMNKENNAPASTTESDKETKVDEHPLHDLSKKPPYEYIVAPRPLFVFELAIANKADDNEVDEEEEEEEEVDQDELAFEQYQKAYQEDPQGELASKHPTHKWVMYRTVLLGYLDLQRLAGYTIPDALGMYITNDWHSYGLLELIDNQLLAFNEAWSKKPDDPLRIKEMWTIITKLIWWLNDPSTDQWMHADDGERCTETATSISTALLACLHELDQAKLLKPGSEILDLELVISMYGYYLDKRNDLGMEFECLEYLNGYVTNAGLDIQNKGFSGKKDVWLVDYESKTMKGKSSDLFGWKKTWTKHKKLAGIGKTPNEKYNILRMSRKARASHAFDKKDPLAGVSDKDLREGNIAIQ